MLDYIRSRAQGWFAWVIVGLITVPFALWGIHNYVGGGGGANYVAKVAGEEISQSHFENTYQQRRQQLEQMFGGQIPASLTDQMLRAQVLEQLVEHEMVIQAAIAQRMRISDQQLADVIRGVDAFHEDGRFSQELYVNLLRRQGMSPAMFEQRVRRDLIAEQFESGFTATAFVTPAEVDNFIRLERQQRNIDWLQIRAEDYVEQLNITDHDIQAYYATNSQRYQTPEQVKVDYLEISVNALTSAIDVAEEDIRIRYEGRLDTYRSPEERRASHILIRVDESAADMDIRSARERAEGLLARIRQGEDFASLASTESEDPGSASDGGDLGYFGRGMMVPSFEDVAFALEVGNVSELVRSPFGFHIIRVESIRGGELKPYDEVRADIQSEIQYEQAAQRYYALAERLATYTYEQPDTLVVAAEELGLTVQSSDFLSRQGGEGIGKHPRVINAAFSDEVLSGVNSEPLEITREHMIVLRLNAHKPAAIRPLEEVRDSILATLRRQGTSELANHTAVSLLAALNDGESAENAATSHGLSWNNNLTLQRNSQELDQLAVRAVYSMPRPVEGKTVNQQVGLPNGDQLIVVLREVMDGNPATVDSEQRKQSEQVLLRNSASTIADALLASIRDKTDITIRR